MAKNLNSKDIKGQTEKPTKLTEQLTGLPTTNLAESIVLATPTPTGSQQPPQQSADPVPGFGTKSGVVAVYPNDVVRLDLYNAANTYLGTNYRIDDWSSERPINRLDDERQSSITDQSTDNTTINLSIDANIQSLGYVAGRYRLQYKFHRNILGSGDGHKLVIQEVSANGLEIRVRPLLSSTIDNTSFLQQFQEGLFKTPKSQVLSNLYIFQDANTSVPVFDYVQDKLTISSAPYSIILKLSSPIATTMRVGSSIWLAQQISNDYSTEALLTPPDLKPQPIQISGPNFDVLAKTRTGFSTEYKDQDDLITSNPTVLYQLQDRLVSSSLVEGIDINTDFRSFENFVRYSSATSRLENFRYKLQLIESYDLRIAALTTDLNGLPNSSASSSLAFTNNININRSRKSAVIGSFDSYEKYLYYQSASYESSSWGEFWPTTWPKQNSTQPYTLYSVTSSQAEEWFEGALASASLYDANNNDLLTRSVPSHVVEDSDNETYLTLVHLAGHYFDDIIPYIEEYTNRYNNTQRLSEGMSKDLLYILGENLGFEFENGSALDELWSYTLGTDVTGSSNTSYNTSVEDTMKETWKRIINNLPYLIKTKGTERCIRALINCFGIPDTILRIKEYGGHEGGFDKKSDYVYDRFYYAFTAGYNGQTSGNPAQQMRARWGGLSLDYQIPPQTVEMRVRMADNQTKDQTIMEFPGSWKIRAFQSGSGKYIGFFLSGSQGWATASVSTSLYDTDTEDPYTDRDTRWHHIALRLENLRSPLGTTYTDNQTYTLIVKTTKYNKVVSTATASLFIDGATSSSYNQAYEVSLDNYIWIPGSGSYAIEESHSMDLFSGSVQELRYWTTPLQDAILDNHALAPTSFQGNTDGVFTGSTSSFDTLAYRFTLGTDNKKTLDTDYPATTSFYSQHPNQDPYTLLNYDLFATFYNITSSAYQYVIEPNSLEWPDLGANRSISSKIRIDNTVLTDNQLFRNNKVEKPLTDNNPPDNAKLGIFLSPTNEVNQDIAEQFGGISIDDYIGDPSHLYLDDYPDLQQLARAYSKKYTATNKPMEYVRLLTHYNAALFKLIKQFVPYRANTITGLLIEPTILERSKVPTPPPTVEDLTLSASLDLNPQKLFPPIGEVEDPTNSPLANYVPEGVIGGDESDYLVLSGEAEEILPQDNEAAIDMPAQPDGDYILVAETVTPIDMTGDPEGAYYEEVDGTIDLGVNGAGWDSRYKGSKYIYYTYNSSGSDPRTLTYVTASRYDDWEAINPSILTSRFSEQSSPDDFKYQKDIWNLKCFENLYTASVLTRFSSSVATQESLWTSQYGLHISESYLGTTPIGAFNTTAYWMISGSRYGVDGSTGPFNGLNYYTTFLGPPRTGSAYINSFFYEREDADTTNYGYRITGTIKSWGTIANTGTITFQMGKSGSSYTHNESWSTVPLSIVKFDFISRVDGPDLFITIQEVKRPDGYVAIQDLQIQPLNYFESVQDYHLWNSRGMINARYEGCKLTSTDYNVDSPDTVDNGPVITITEVGSNILSIKPNKQPGSFEIQ